MWEGWEGRGKGEKSRREGKRRRRGKDGGRARVFFFSCGARGGVCVYIQSEEALLLCSAAGYARDGLGARLCYCCSGCCCCER